MCPVVEAIQNHASTPDIAALVKDLLHPAEWRIIEEGVDGPKERECVAMALRHAKSRIEMAQSFVERIGSANQ